MWANSSSGREPAMQCPFSMTEMRRNASSTFQAGSMFSGKVTAGGDITLGNQINVYNSWSCAIGASSAFRGVSNPSGLVVFAVEGKRGRRKRRCWKRRARNRGNKGLKYTYSVHMGIRAISAVLCNPDMDTDVIKSLKVSLELYGQGCQTASVLFILKRTRRKLKAELNGFKLQHLQFTITIASIFLEHESCTSTNGSSPEIQSPKSFVVLIDFLRPTTATPPSNKTGYCYVFWSYERGKTKATVLIGPTMITRF
ncbi:hypothetical protein EDB81DRAFT_895862 [Dactylonectria macrodidyma]|uniref:Uncharacterized protein n=1 Tax=Dactylonectria macrodidyma TaxID=307937 RepID=A0A9P9FQM9_9HYPO|nr:hypothetical protein EDB81DRAFT_895862 [Dactylonectria macrodidyma]